MWESQWAAGSQKREPESARIEVARMLEEIVDVLGGMEGGNWEKSVLQIFTTLLDTDTW